MELEEDYIKNKETGSMTRVGYMVEARSSLDPIEVCGKLYGEKWKVISFIESEVGIPIKRREKELVEHGLYCYVVAQALRWWFLSTTAPFEGFNLETRLVEHMLVIDHKVTATNYCDVTKGGLAQFEVIYDNNTNRST